jgi:hypothetical protein
MVSTVFVLLFALVLLAVMYSAGELGTNLGTFLVVTFASRLLLHWVVRNVAFFSHGLGGDAITYEYFAQWIAEHWTVHGFKFLTAADNDVMGTASLPPNMFAAIVYLNGGQPAPVGCTALVALAICLAALNFFKLAIELGARRGLATNVTIVLFSSPALIFYTADMYKDGLVLMFVLGAVASAIRVSRKFSLLHMAIGLMCLFALWFVRFYLVFLASLPVLVGYMGFGSKGYLRPFLSLLGLTLVLGVLIQSQQGNELRTTIDGTFTVATDKAAIDGNALGGSAVQLGMGIGSLPIRLIYTLFSPFPWMGGTMGLQLGKIDTLLFWYFLYRAAIATRKLLRSDRSTLVSLLVFIVPCTVAYAFTMANMGLMLRQRLPIVVMVALLATLSWPSREEVARAREARKKRLAEREASQKKPSLVPARTTAALALAAGPRRQDRP